MPELTPKEQLAAFRQCCRLVLEFCPGVYAKTYARAGLRDMDMQNAGTHKNNGYEYMKVQALYILNNMQHWRGENATKVRYYLKTFSKP